MRSPPVVTVPFALLTGGHFLSSVGYASMALLPLYLDHLDASQGMVGAIMASAAVGGLASRPLVGWALDTFGRRPTLIASTLLLVFGMLGLGLVTEIGWLVFATRLVIGAGVGGVFTAYFAFIADVVPIQRRTEGIALFGISGLVPLAFNPFAQRLGVDPASLRLLFPTLAVVVLLSAVAVWATPEPDRSGSRTPLRLREVLLAFRHRTLLPVWLATVVFASLFGIFFAFAAVTAKHRLVGDPAAMWFTYALGAVAVRLFGARVLDVVGTSRLVVPALGTYMVGVLIAALSGSTWGFAASGLFAGLGHGLCFPLLASQTATRSPERLRGSAMAAFTALWDIAALAVVPLFGVIADGTSDGTMLLTAVVCAAVGVAVWGVLERAALTLLAASTSSAAR